MPIIRRKGGCLLSSFVLRFIALLCMCIDHAGLALFPNIGLFRCIGRVAFPLYCFLAVQGFVHTRSVRSYCRRLLLAAILSEIPFDLLIFGRISSGMEQNVLFSLLFGLMALATARAYRRKPIAAFLMIITLSMGAMITRVSFGWLGIALCLSAYYAGNRKLLLALYTAASLLIYSLSLRLSGVAESWVLVSFCALFALLPMLLYSGKRGFRTPIVTFLFYAAYPLHLLALIAIRAMRIIPPNFLN